MSFYTYKIHGRKYSFTRIVRCCRPRPGLWKAATSNGEYTIEGGRAAGGTSRGWFVDGPGIVKSIRCSGIVDALKLIDSI